MKSEVIAVSFGQRSDFPRADALWFSDGRTFISDNGLGEMWKYRIEKTTNRVASGIKQNKYAQNDFIQIFTGHLSGRLVFSHLISDPDEADSIIKNNDLNEVSLRRLEPDPWETIHDRYSVGDIVDARITGLANFGAFARLEDSIEGLIHVTELSAAVVTNPSEVVSEGEVWKVKILRIEADRKRLGLSLKQAEDGFVEEDYLIESSELVDQKAAEPLENTEALGEADLEEQQQEQE